MTLILSLIVLLLIVFLLLALVLLQRHQRSGQLQQLADRLTLSYRPFASLSQPLRQARFLIFSVGQMRYFRHLLEGSYQPQTSHFQQQPLALSQRRLNVFDYGLVSDKGTHNQTLMLFACSLNCGCFRIQPHAWLHADVFADSEPLLRLSQGQYPPALHSRQLFGQHPARLTALLTPQVQHWLLAHPHLHIEFSNGILLLYRPAHRLAVEDIEAALEAGCQLAELLQLSERQ